MADQQITDWVGRTETQQDRIDLRQAMLMQSILPVEADLKVGSPLPPLWTWLYFPQPTPLSGLGRDGHPAKGGFLPPVNLPRRMWAGGRFDFHEPIRIGHEVTRRSEILKVVPKTGRSGRLCFVTVEHRYQLGNSLAWREEHDIVYREDPAPGAPQPKPVRPPAGPVSQQETVVPSPVMLFRYSALTFNGHRIHYDRDYAREVEGYPGLVFHGPLTATLLADLALRTCGRELTRFAYRAVSPLFDAAPFTICAGPVEKGCLSVWAATPGGMLAMQGEAEVA